MTENPVEVAAYDTFPDNDAGGYYGCWIIRYNENWIYLC